MFQKRAPRRVARHRMTLHAVTGARVAEVRNISVSGMLVRLADPLCRGDRIWFEVLGSRVNAIVRSSDGDLARIAFEKPLSERTFQTLLRSAGL